MELGLTGDCVHFAEDLSGLDLVAGPDGDTRQFAVEREVVAVLDQYALVEARLDYDLADDSVEDGFD